MPQQSSAQNKNERDLFSNRLNKGVKNLRACLSKKWWQRGEKKLLPTLLFLNATQKGKFTPSQQSFIDIPTHTITTMRHSHCCIERAWVLETRKWEIERERVIIQNLAVYFTENTKFNSQFCNFASIHDAISIRRTNNDWNVQQWAKGMCLMLQISQSRVVLLLVLDANSV